jgi:hypothetical protein
MKPNTKSTRRSFLKTASTATLGALTAGWPRAIQARDSRIGASHATADRVIVLFMGGGMAHTETFDPKRHTPFRKGLNPAQVLSTFPTIDTAADPIKFTAGLEKIASVMDRGTLIRGYTAGDLGHILHTRHQYQWHTGYTPPQTVAAPHIGSVIARALGPLNPAVPAFIDIGQRFDMLEGEEMKVFHSAGFLGSEYGPFMIQNPDQAAAAARPPGGMTPSRFANRDKFYRKLVANSPVMLHGGDYQRESLLRSLDNAHRLLSSDAAQAFDLSREPRENLRRYLPDTVDTSKVSRVKQTRDGAYERDTLGRFGMGCLLARRLCEVGARFIEVGTEYIPFLNWDTHDNGHTRVIDMKRAIDGPVAQLVLDLEERGLLDRTLIVLASEFSRDMLIEGSPAKVVFDEVPVPPSIEELKYYGMHRHFTDAGCVLLFGGGIKKGHLHGETADERPCGTIKDRVVIEDLHATIYHALGIPPTLAYEVEKRPFYVTRDGKGKVIHDLLA